MKILIALRANEHHKEQLQRNATGAELLFVPADQVREEDLADVDAIIGNVPTELLPAAKKLRWLQLNTAGADTYCKEGVLKDDVLLTNATGAYGLALSEHLLAQLLAMMKKLYPYYDNQKKGIWHDEGSVTSIEDATVLILGAGDIGRAFARRVKALGAYVIGVRRREGAKPFGIDEMGTMEELDSLLARADVVVSVLPGTTATRGIFDKKRFTAMKKGSYFLNIGRGNAVVTEDLIEVMKEGRLAGAALDVTDPEPLPADHALWHTPNVYITPHISGDDHLSATQDKIVQIAARNLAAFMQGVPLENLVNRTTGYKD